jgi:hypothetical protein
MVFIKIYYYLFFAFIYLLIGLCEVVKWLLNPRFNWTFLRQLIHKTHFPFQQSIRPKAEQF